MRVPALLFLLFLAPPGFAREGGAPYRLEAVDLEQPILWGAEVRLAEGTGLAFGGLDQDAADARPHTRILVDGEWVAIDGRLRERNPVQALHERLWKLRNRVKDTLAQARRLYFEGLPEDREKAEWKLRIAPALGSIRAELESLRSAAVVKQLVATTAIPRNSALSSPSLLTELRELRIALELAAEDTAAEPPARALNCGPKQNAPASPQTPPLIHEPKTGKFILFGGDHLDYLTNDLWLFDPTIPRWEKQHPKASPPPRANHRLSAPGDGTVRMIGGYTYQSYACDPPSGKMVSVGQRSHFHIYDPDKADWIARGDKPEAMSYSNCFYTLTLTSTPRGALCWDKNGAVHRFDSSAGAWRPFATKGAQLPGAYVDSSSIVYDSRRDRVLIVNTTGYQKPYTGQVWALSLESRVVIELSPSGMKHADRLATVDKSCYEPVNDLMLFGTFLEDHPEPRTPTPAYDCAANRWITLDLECEVAERNGQPARMFPHTRSDALMFDPKRKLIWGLDTDGQAYVIRLDKSGATPLAGR